MIKLLLQAKRPLLYCIIFGLIWIMIFRPKKNLNCLIESDKNYQQQFIIAENMYVKTLTSTQENEIKTNNEVSLSRCRLDYDCSNGRSYRRFLNAKERRVSLLKLYYKKSYNYTQIVMKYPEVKLGGSWAPSNCSSNSSLAIIVPFRKRDKHLVILLDFLIPFLQKQKKAFRIFVIEQAGDEIFNRAALLNIGYTVASRIDQYDCYIFHDVDLIPEDWCNLYVCSNQPRHLAVAMNKFQYSLPYSFYVGGALALSGSIMKKINGFSNIMFGWGGEDDDTYARLRKHGYTIDRYNRQVGRYTMIRHRRDKSNPGAKRSQQDVSSHWKYSDYDGLSSINYELKDTKLYELYTKIVVQIPGPNSTHGIKPFYDAHKLKYMLQFRADEHNSIIDKEKINSTAKMLKDEMKSYDRVKTVIKTKVNKSEVGTKYS